MRHIVKLFLAYAIASAAFQACAEPVAPQAPQAHHDVCSGGGTSDWDICSDTTP